MPNRSGGKGYKRQKKGGGDGEDPEMAMIDREKDQFVARAVRLLGNRNVLCYCQDDRLRICHICNRMKKFKIWVEAGDVVLISIREFELVDNTMDKRRGDIIGKYSTDMLSRLRKEPGMNQKLFMKLEGMEGIRLEEVGLDKSKDEKLQKEDEMDDLFEHGSDDEESESEGEGGEKNEIVSSKKNRGARAAAATAAAADDDDIDIDAI